MTENPNPMETMSPKVIEQGEDTQGELTLEDIVVQVRMALVRRMHDVLTYIEQAEPDDTTPDDLRKLREEMLDVRSTKFSDEALATLGRLWDDSREAILEEMREELLAYYRSEKGLEEIRQSPHRDKTPEEVVELVLQDVGAWMLRVPMPVEEKSDGEKISEEARGG